MARYAWIIDKDHLFDDDRVGDKGTIGPGDAPDALVARLNAGEGHRFRMFDDDGELYYSGRYIHVDPEMVDSFKPLDDFGTGNAGCTEIRYLDRGKWERL